MADKALGATKPEDNNTMNPVLYADYILITARDCHTAAAEAGWWTSPTDGSSLIGKRDFIAMCGLIVTEITEAADGFYENSYDDKLPHRLQLEVELADAFIRMGDTSFGNNVDLAAGIAYISKEANGWQPFSDEMTTPEMLLKIIGYISYAVEGHRKRDDFTRNINMARAMLAVMVMCEVLKLDLKGAVGEKMAFNKVRPDHKLENRMKEGGKKE